MPFMARHSTPEQLAKSHVAALDWTEMQAYFIPVHRQNRKSSRLESYAGFGSSGSPELRVPCS
jgi:hypothetical protein